MKNNRIFLRASLFLLLVSLLLCACQGTKAADPPHTDFFENVSFLGDSITAHMESRAGISPSRLWVTRERYLNLDSRITYARILAPDTGEEETIACVAARLKPPFLVITLGVDYGVYYYRNDLSLFEKYYEKLLDAITEASPETTLLLQSVFPVTAASKSITNEMIDNANASIRAIAERRALHYLDTQSVLRDENGYLRAEFCSSADGIHLSEQGYRAVLSYIGNFAAERGWRA